MPHLFTYNALRMFLLDAARNPLNHANGAPVGLLGRQAQLSWSYDPAQHPHVMEIDVLVGPWPIVRSLFRDVQAGLYVDAEGLGRVLHERLRIRALTNQLLVTGEEEDNFAVATDVQIQAIKCTPLSPPSWLPELAPGSGRVAPPQRRRRLVRIRKEHRP